MISNKKLTTMIAMLLITISSLQAVTYWTDDFETDKGWTFSGNAQQSWVRGTPAGGSGVGPDPVGAYQGSYCLGNNMTSAANYQYASSESSFAVSPAINCTGAGSVHVSFYRWLCTKGASNTVCSLAVSNDGTTWTGVFGNPNPALDDVAWQYVSYDISAVAANQPTVYIRFRLKDSGAAPPRHGGWNIDNIEVKDSPLGVSLSHFTSEVRSDAVELAWRTECENDCAFWSIERSFDQGSGYRTIGRISGGGNSCQAKDYSFRDQTLTQAGQYFYRLAQVGGNGEASYFGPISVYWKGAIEEVTDFLQSYPNPARPGRTSIIFSSAILQKASLKMYNITGALVRTLFDGTISSGKHQIIWDGRDQMGNTTVPGIYILKLSGEKMNITRRVTLLK